MALRLITFVAGGALLGLGIGLGVANVAAGIVAGLGVGLLLAAGSTLRGRRASEI
ncbi:MAG: hypothetical protein ACRDG7_05500 [Candidatus Limnocylindria bacterium]